MSYRNEKLICLLFAITACAAPKITKAPPVVKPTVSSKPGVPIPPPEPAPDDAAQEQKKPDQVVDTRSELEKVYDKAMERTKDDGAAKDLVSFIYKSKGFELLDDDERILMLRLSSGKNPLSVDARRRLNAGAYRGANAEAQKAMLISLKKPEIYLLPLSQVKYASSSMGGSFDVRIWPRSVNYVESDGFRYDVDLAYGGNRSLRVPVDYHKTGNYDGWISGADMAAALTAVPFELARAIRSVRVSDFPTANATTGSDRTIDYGAKNSPHPARTITHEAGHAATQYFVKTIGDINNFYTAIGKESTLYPSAYAATQELEWIAEIAVLYTEVQEKGPFRDEYLELFPLQIAFMRDSLSKVK